MVLFSKPNIRYHTTGVEFHGSDGILFQGNRLHQDIRDEGSVS